MKRLISASSERSLCVFVCVCVRLLAKFPNANLIKLFILTLCISRSIWFAFRAHFSVQIFTRHCIVRFTYFFIVVMLRCIYSFIAIHCDAITLCTFIHFKFLLCWASNLLCTEYKLDTAAILWHIRSKKWLKPEHNKWENAIECGNMEGDEIMKPNNYLFNHLSR